MEHRSSWPIVGQVKLGVHLLDALRRGRLPSVLMFSGPASLGKMTGGLWLAQYDLCRQQRSRPCGTCTSCRMMTARQHPSLHLVDPPGSTTIGVEDIRQMIHGYTRTSWSDESRWCLIIDADRMTEGAANTMLKFLEEIPPRVHVVLTTSVPEHLPATIRSRTTTYVWHLVTDDEMMTGFDLNRSDRQLLARAAGRPGWAQRLRSDANISADRQTANTALGYFQHGSWPKADSRGGESESALDREEMLVRELLLCKAGVNSRTLWPDLQPDMTAVLDRFSLAQLLELSARYLDRHTYSTAIQPRLVYDDLHLV